MIHGNDWQQRGKVWRGCQYMGKGKYNHYSDCPQVLASASIHPLPRPPTDTDVPLAVPTTPRSQGLNKPPASTLVQYTMTGGITDLQHPPTVLDVTCRPPTMAHGPSILEA